jgi:hypothetical protein
MTHHGSVWEWLVRDWGGLHRCCYCCCCGFVQCDASVPARLPHNPCRGVSDVPGPGTLILAVLWLTNVCLVTGVCAWQTSFTLPSNAHVRATVGDEQVCSGHGACIGAPTGFCDCYMGYTGDACSQCTHQFVARASFCVFLPGALATCSDGVRNGHEVGVDCGGDCGVQCSAGGVGPLSSRSSKVCVRGRNTALDMGHMGLSPMMGPGPIPVMHASITTSLEPVAPPSQGVVPQWWLSDGGVAVPPGAPDAHHTMPTYLHTDRSEPLCWQRLECWCRCCCAWCLCS